MNQIKARKLAREINALLKQEDEVVLETSDIQSFLSDGQTVDSVAAMEIVREIADAHDWSAFVYDYGALVRFTRKPGAATAGTPPKDASRQPQLNS